MEGKGIDGQLTLGASGRVSAIGGGSGSTGRVRVDAVQADSFLPSWTTPTAVYFNLDTDVVRSTTTPSPVRPRPRTTPRARGGAP